MKRTCCRSTPRCAACPVLAAARSRAVHRAGGADVFAAVLAGPVSRELPACVRDALGALDARRSAGLAVQRPPTG